jgi:type I restriction enzyme S subunit
MSARPSYKLTELGEIPENWDLARLGDETQNLAEVIMGQSPPSSTYNETGQGLPFLQGNAEFGETYPTPRVYTSNPLKICEKDDILISVRAPVGEINLSPSSCCIGRGLSAIRTNPSKLNRQFAFYYLKHAINRLLALASGSTFTAVRRGDLESLWFAIPPIREQEKIASVLSTADNDIQKTNGIITKTQQLKKGLMQELMTRGLGHTKSKEPTIGQLPEEWKISPIARFGEVVTGSTPSTGVRDYYGSDYPFVSPADMGAFKEIKATRKRLTKKGLDAVRRIPARSVLVTCISSLDGIGKVGMSSTECATNQQINSIICNDGTDPDFLYYCIDFHRRRIQAFAARSSGHFAIIPKETFSQVPMPQPSKSEQSKIGGILSSVDSKLDNELSHLEALRMLKRGLMQALLTGEVRVRVS